MAKRTTKNQQLRTATTAMNVSSWPLVRAVSRSFYLTLRLLPCTVRPGITFAYLLARASDTIADTSRMTVSARLRTLKFLREFAQNEDRDQNFQLDQNLARFQDHPGEKQLLEQLPTLVGKLKKHVDREDICKVWDTILEGQIFDLEHSFSVPLEREQLERYTYLVAGCVGQFWTRLCFRKVSQFTALPIQQMEELGIRYGQGLQLINILRDRKEDALRGRVYIREEDVEEYRRIALAAMRAGRKYAVAANPPFLRYATLLPALLGVRTLRLIKPQPEKVKISRAEVYRTLITALPYLWNKGDSK